LSTQISFFWQIFINKSILFAYKNTINIIAYVDIGKWYCYRSLEA